MVETSTTKPPVKTPVMNQPPTASVKTDSDTLKVRSLDEAEEKEKKEEKAYGKVVYVVFGILLVLGVVTGFFLANQRASSSAFVAGTAENAQSGTAVGSTDTKTFKDSATGTLEIGGLDGEGTHQLVREGGPSQTVYLISSVVDMDQFAGKEVTVWGQTMDAKKAAWLMDVGKIEIK